MPVSATRLSPHNITIFAIDTSALLCFAAFIFAMLGDSIYRAAPPFLTITDASIALGVLVCLLIAMAYLYRKGYPFAVDIAIIAMVLSIPFVFDTQAFLGSSVPPGIWLPFVFALTTRRLRIAVIALAASLGIALLTYPGAFQSPRAILETAIIFAVLIACKFMLRRMFGKARKEDATMSDELSAGHIDQLTGLPNRTLLLDRLNQVISISSRSGMFSALLFIDLDHFKNINDTYGHQKGDLVLKQVAQCLLLRVREGDTVSRFGGDEFVVLLTELGIDAELAANKANAVSLKLLEALNQTYQLDEVVHHSTASIGVTMFNGKYATSDDLLKQADMAMYKSKKSGKNALRFFDPTLEYAMKHHATMEKDLRIALKREQFVLHYQGQFTSDAKLTGAEVLLRWKHPEQGLMSPNLFIPFAEETGLILPIGNWVLETACNQLALWKKIPDKRHLVLAVNVSALQFKQADFINTVLNIIRRTGANPHRLKLELTESMLIENVDDIIKKMLILKKYGIRFSLDDFGTGYSSLSSLKRLPLDQLKIDQSFIHDVQSDPTGAAIAETIVSLGKSLKLNVIAEGVETTEQHQFLSNAGCFTYQGYLFSRPLAIQEFEGFAMGQTEARE